ENINFVTPDHMLPMILLALGSAKNDGLEIPIVYNCSGYAKVEILSYLSGIIDVYLVDMRYNDDKVAKKYSGCENYTATNRFAIQEIFNQVGNLKINQNGRAESGMIVRHLVLPDQLSGSKEIFDFLAKEISDEVYVSLMSQYFPAYKAVDDKIINRRLSTDEFQQVSDAFYEAGLKNGYIQNYSIESI
ncbi:MAG: radical SAM protein, partial [candidate division Zixibacteria bacterium]|nr:radical SAM protein [candidate division Zixibacteria bacterium]